jgi:hypothetical protein
LPAVFNPVVGGYANVNDAPAYFLTRALGYAEAQL